MIVRQPLVAFLIMLISSQFKASSFVASYFFDRFGLAIAEANFVSNFSPRWERTGFFSSLNC